MTDFQHALVGLSALMFLWMVWGRQLMSSPKDENSWEEWKRIFRQ